MHAFLTKLAQQWPPAAWRDVSVLVAISGGADSVALLRGLKAIAQPGDGKLIAAHFNHRWRGAESDEDARFTGQLCQQLGLPLEMGSPPEFASVPPGDGLEAAARAERYAFLAAAADKWGARHVATAHTADDQVETVLHRMIRGTGLAGLAGIPRTRPLTGAATLIRPLLTFHRAELLDYLASINQPYRTDSSNADIRFTRNRVRHQLLPELERDFNPAVRDALLRLARLAGETQHWVEQQAEQLALSAVRQTSYGYEVLCTSLQAAPRPLVREFFVRLWVRANWPLQMMGNEKWEQLADFALLPFPDQAADRRLAMFPGGIQVQRCLDILSLRKDKIHLVLRHASNEG